MTTQLDLFRGQRDLFKGLDNAILTAVEPEAVVTVRLTPRQLDLVDDELCRISDIRDVDTATVVTTATTVSAPASVLGYLAEGIEMRLDDDHEDLILAKADTDLTDAQIAFGVRAKLKSIRAVVKKLRQAIQS